MTDARAPRSARETESALAPEEQAPRLMLWPKRVCYLAYAVAALALAHGLGLSWIYVLAFLAPLALVEVWLRRVVAKKMSRFDQALRAHMQAGRDDELEGLLLGQRLLRFAAPRYYLQSKRGLIYQHLGRPRAAAAAFRDALEQAPGDKRFAQALNLAGCLNQIGQEEEAERIYRQALDGDHRSASASAAIARLVLRRGGDPEEAEAYLVQAVEWQGGGPLRLELVELLLTQAKSEEAASQLQRAAEEAELGGWDEDQLGSLARLQTELGVAGGAGSSSEEPAGPS